MRSTVFFHLFVLAVFSTVGACGPAETEPPTGSDSSQQEVRDAGTSISLDAGISSAPDAGTTSEVDSGTSADPCAPYADMARGEYTCDTAFRPTVRVTLDKDFSPGNCVARMADFGGGLIVETIPNPIPDRYSYVQPNMVSGATGANATVPSFVAAFSSQGSEVRNTCSR